MKQKLLAVAALLLAMGGGVVFINWDASPVEITQLPESFGNIEVIDRSLCTVSACNSAACVTALAMLADGGVTDATMRFVECPIRLGARARAFAADAGVIFPAGTYQQIRLIAMRRNGAIGIAVDANGWPVYAVASINSPCAWKPNAGAACTRVDGGVALTQSVMDPGQWAGLGCVRRSCVQIAGDPEP